MPDVLVLCYHAVSPGWTADLSVTPDQFERQIAYLLRRRWRPVTFAEAALEPPARRTLAITFDDAFASVKEHAAPILARGGIPATVFAPTGYMDGGKRLTWPGVDHWQQTSSADELAAMDWDDLTHLAELGWEIGSHTCTHPHLRSLDDATLTLELRASREQLADHLGRECQTIAYPYGDADTRVLEAASSAGYLAGAGLSSRLERRKPHLQPRVGIYHNDSGSRFQLKTARPMRELRATQLWPG
ncbi:MAG: polysaccharide deacetylase family protein [Actinomycetota bacterium]|nr:polysaccharide deacetylase family protein [Actinomycetota bacterium]